MRQNREQLNNDLAQIVSLALERERRPHVPYEVDILGEGDSWTHGVAYITMTELTPIIKYKYGVDTSAKIVDRITKQGQRISAIQFTKI